MKDNWLIFNDKFILFENLYYDLIQIAKKSIIQKGFFNLVLTGGNSILGLYRYLRKANAEFDKWFIYISDERFLPKDHENRNDRHIYELWLDKIFIPKKNIKFIKPELGLDLARKDYEQKLCRIESFDLVILSVGDDGHISSLFPGHNYDENQLVIIEKNSPKPPQKRISMSYKMLNNTKNLFKIIIGNEKKHILKKMIDGASLPVNSISGKKEKVFIHNSLFQKS